jgi:DNA-binding SARP family transcriptional activator
MKLERAGAGPALKISTFGGLRISGPDGDITRFRTRQTAALLGYLLHRGGTQISRDHLVEVLWPEAPPERGRHNLSVALSALRKSIGANLEANHSFVSLSADLDRDLSEFQRLEGRSDAASLSRRIDLYRGPFLAGLHDDWLIPVQADFEATFADDCKRLIEIHLLEGDTHGALEVLTTWIKHVPEDEDAAIYRAKLSQQKSKRRPRTVECLGRQIETRTLVKLIDGGAKLVTIRGPGGVGKTTLGVSALEVLSKSHRCHVVRLAHLQSGSDLFAQIGQAIGLSPG